MERWKSSVAAGYKWQGMVLTLSCAGSRTSSCRPDWCGRVIWLPGAKELSWPGEKRVRQQYKQGESEVSRQCHVCPKTSGLLTLGQASSRCYDVSDSSSGVISFCDAKRAHGPLKSFFFKPVQRQKEIKKKLRSGYWNELKLSFSRWSLWKEPKCLSAGLSASPVCVCDLPSGVAATLSGAARQLQPHLAATSAWTPPPHSFPSSLFLSTRSLLPLITNTCGLRRFHQLLPSPQSVAAVAPAKAAPAAAFFLWAQHFGTLGDLLAPKGASTSAGDRELWEAQYLYGGNVTF